MTVVRVGMCEDLAPTSALAQVKGSKILILGSKQQLIAVQRCQRRGYDRQGRSLLSGHQSDLVEQLIVVGL